MFGSNKGLAKGAVTPKDPASFKMECHALCITVLLFLVFALTLSIVPFELAYADESNDVANGTEEQLDLAYATEEDGSAEAEVEESDTQEADEELAPEVLPETDESLESQEQAISYEEEEVPAGAPAEGDDPSGSIYTTRTPRWVRLWGNTALDTMRAIVRADGVFKDGRRGTVVVATADGYRDALAATALAGRLDAPVLITPKGKLASQTKAELQRLKPSKVIVIGGEAVISKNCFTQIKAVCSNTVRVSGKTGSATAVAAYKAGSNWSSTCIISTSNSFKDALSIAPYAYAMGAPIFLVEPNKTSWKRTLSDTTLRAIDAGNFTRAIIVGGDKAVPESVEQQIWYGTAVSDIRRLSGNNALETSAAIARWSIENGMSFAHKTFATTTGYKDALCGAALAGKQKSVLILVDENINKISPEYGFEFSYMNADLFSGNETHGHILGGRAVISQKLWRQLSNTSLVSCGKHSVKGGTYNGWTINFYGDGSLGAIPKGGSKETKFGQWQSSNAPGVSIKFDGKEAFSIPQTRGGNYGWDFFGGVIV